MKHPIGQHVFVCFYTHISIHRRQLRSWSVLNDPRKSFRGVQNGQWQYGVELSAIVREYSRDRNEIVPCGFCNLTVSWWCHCTIPDIGYGFPEQYTYVRTYSPTSQPHPSFCFATPESNGDWRSGSTEYSGDRCHRCHWKMLGRFTAEGKGISLGLEVKICFHCKAKSSILGQDCQSDYSDEEEAWGSWSGVWGGYWGRRDSWKTNTTCPRSVLWQRVIASVIPQALSHSFKITPNYDLFIAPRAYRFLDCTQCTRGKCWNGPGIRQDCVYNAKYIYNFIVVTMEPPFDIHV